MKFSPLTIAGAWRVEPQPVADERGFFARTWCQQEFAAQGLETRLVQCSVSVSPRRGTLRGMHYQAPPHGEVKLVRCTRGAIYDVLVDLRPDSATLLAWEAVELTADNRHAVYIPPGVAHGFLTLVDDCEVYYQMSEFYHAEAARGARWNDPAFGIVWPQAVTTISERDSSYPLWTRG